MLGGVTIMEKKTTVAQETKNYHLVQHFPSRYISSRIESWSQREFCIVIFI